MGDVVQFEKPDPHHAGTAKCLGCSHEWTAVAPVGVWLLKCPRCSCLRGIFKLNVGPQEGDLYYSCAHCGNEAMTAYRRNGHFYFVCMKCGVDHTESLFGGP